MSQGFKYRHFRVEHLKEAKIHFLQLRDSGLVDGKIYDRYLAGFQYEMEPILENAKSIILVAMPQYASRVTFNIGGMEKHTVLPPQYAYPALESAALEFAKETFGKNGVIFASPKLPLKYLSAMSGLCKVGRNNLCYTEDFGSYMRLTGFVSNMAVEEDHWTGLQRMQTCNKCRRCAENCPAGVIDEDRYLIHAEKCMTYFNEETNPIPEGIKPEWHNAIVGCMGCQAVCPMNAKVKDQIDMEIAFDERETIEIMNQIPVEELNPKTREKLETSGLLDYWEVLGRNLKMLMR